MRTALLQKSLLRKLKLFKKNELRKWTMSFSESHGLPSTTELIILVWKFSNWKSQCNDCNYKLDHLLWSSVTSRPVLINNLFKISFPFNVSNVRFQSSRKFLGWLICKAATFCKLHNEVHNMKLFGIALWSNYSCTCTEDTWVNVSHEFPLKLWGQFRIQFALKA